MSKKWVIARKCISTITLRIDKNKGIKTAINHKKKIKKKEVEKINEIEQQK